ncbi:MAG TPA: terminase family protein [Solirubrobacteraceae bacterium]|nr:terminase family protein [Solirubrobacteraceae bacterium]
MTSSLGDGFVARLDFVKLEWQPKGRAALEPHQIAPAGDWSLWLLEGGRGSGKTEACSRYFATYMRTHPGARGRIIAPTFGDAAESCILGPSGLLSVDPEIRWAPSDPGGAKVFWPNGSQALVLGTPTPRDVDRLRAGGNRHIDWWEEMAANAQLSDAWNQAALGLRLGERPHSIASTTPRSTGAYRRIRATRGTVFTRGTLFDNPHNPADWVEQMRERYADTHMGRQELGGELLTESEPDAVVSLSAVAEACARSIEIAPEDRVVIACDVARFGSDETVIAERVGQRVRIVESYVGRKPGTTSTGAAQGDLVQTAGRIVEHARRHSRPHVRMVVDDTGVGGGVTDILRNGGWDVTAFNGSERARDPRHFPNRRSELWFQMAAQLEYVDLDADDQLEIDLTEPRYRYDLKMRKVVEPKDETKKRLGRSPDRADAVNLTLVGGDWRPPVVLSDEEQAARDLEEALLAQERAVRMRERWSDMPRAEQRRLAAGGSIMGDVMNERM